jgi:accessory colonization factor AcfC
MSALMYHNITKVMQHMSQKTTRKSTKNLGPMPAWKKGIRSHVPADISFSWASELQFNHFKDL